MYSVSILIQLMCLQLIACILRYKWGAMHTDLPHYEAPYPAGSRTVPINNVLVLFQHGCKLDNPATYTRIDKTDVGDPLPPPPPLLF